MKDHTSLGWLDQDVVNGVCKGQIKNVGNEFDFMTFYCYDKIKKKSLLKQELSYQNVNSVKDIIIIHYTGDKPWNYINVPLSSLWWREVKNLPKELKCDLKKKYKPKKYYKKVGYFFHKIAVKLGLIFNKK